MKIFYFAQAADTAGCREESWELQSPLTASEFWGELEKRHPGMGALQSICRIACNCEYLGPEERIQADDEVALIPPVSGG